MSAPENTLFDAMMPVNYSGAEFRFARFGAHRLRYLVCGESGPTLVFVHGWACHLDFWREQRPAFAGRARLLSIDLPGHGGSDQPHVAYTMDFHAQAVMAVLQAAQVEHAIFVGHSMGAAVLCRVYGMAPEKFQGLVSVDGLLCRPPRTPGFARQFVAPFWGAAWQEHARSVFNDFFPVPGTERLRDAVVAEMLHTPQHVIASEADHLTNPALPDWTLTKLAVPLFVLNARHPLWSQRYERYVQSLTSRVDYRVYDDVGHFLMLEKPALINRELIGMLAQSGWLPA